MSKFGAQISKPGTQNATKRNISGWLSMITMHKDVRLFCKHCKQSIK